VVKYELQRCTAAVGGSAKMFGSLGFGEVMLILIIGLIIFGPKKLPEIGRSLGNAIREFRRASNDIVNTFSLDTDYSTPTTTRRSYTDYGDTYTSTFSEQTVSQSDIPADDINVAPSPQELSYVDPAEATDSATATVDSSKPRHRARRVLATRRMAAGHRNSRRRV
jgi:sec-independent protein translocase protein TatA